MRTRTIIALGKKKSGKTQLLRRLTGEQFNESYDELLAHHYGLFTYVHQSNKFNCWELSEANVYLNQFPSIEPKFFIYCVDVSKPLDEPRLDILMDEIKKNHPDNIFVLVATHADRCEHPTHAQTRLAQLSLDPHIEVITSAKTAQGIKDLFLKITLWSRMSLIKELKLDLLPSVLDLSMKPSSTLYTEIQTFMRNFKTISIKEQEAGLAEYLKRCKAFYTPKPTLTMNTIFWASFALTALFIILAGGYMLSIASSITDLTLIHTALKPTLVIPLIVIGFFLFTAGTVASYGFFSNKNHAQNATHSKQTSLLSLQKKGDIDNSMCQDENRALHEHIALSMN